MKRSDVEAILRRRLEGYAPEIERSEVGEVVEAGDGIARIYGLESVMAGEILEFEGGARGLALNLEEESVGAVILSGEVSVREGVLVRRTGRLLEVPVGESLVGRVVSPLGDPLDGKGPVKTSKSRPIERVAPGVVTRQPVRQPLQTGIKAIDSMTPIGRGQRELIIGDRQTGKTAIAVDTIVNQKDQGVVCIYVAIGQKRGQLAKIVDVLERSGAMSFTVVIAATASEPAPLLYLAPYAGCAVGEEVMESGGDALCIYDDLTKHAWAYRQLSLLLRRPPGREAYPGDIFYLHSRLLERAVKLAERYRVVREDGTPSGEKIYVGPLGLEEAERMLSAREARDAGSSDGALRVERVPGTGGSLTALPIVETQAGDVAAYIPTNIISITDGQIYLESDLFNQGVRPAINAGISVSRVGGNAQISAMKKVAGMLRLDLAQYRELAAFARFGAELDPATQRLLARGERMVEILKQEQYRPMPVEEQVVSLFCATRGVLDKVPAEEARRFEKEFLEHVRGEKPELLGRIREEKDLDEEIEGGLMRRAESFRRPFLKDLGMDSDREGV